MIRCERKDLSRLNLRISALLDTSALVFTQISFRFALAGFADFNDAHSRQLSRLPLSWAYLIFGQHLACTSDSEAFLVDQILKRKCD